MAAIRDILIYLLRSSPPGEGISCRRIENLAYLADWKSAIDRERQLSPAKWAFDIDGPVSPDVFLAIQREKTIFRIEEGSRTARHSERPVIKLADWRAVPRLDPSEIAILDHVLSATSELDWIRLVKLVLSTYPLISSDRYTPLDLVAKARRYKASDFYQGATVGSAPTK